ncbi:MAG: hypothetical protein K0U59_01230 [Gammaproteobacteria bacterium]|nr:hypothetical protein [Gammaproteobacteria bacterium]
MHRSDPVSWSFRLAAGSLGNALLKERQDWHWLSEHDPLRHNQQEMGEFVIALPVGSGEYLLIPVEKPSQVYVFRFSYNWWRASKQKLTAITLAQAVDALCELECKQGGDTRVLAAFKQRVDHSLHNLQQTLYLRSKDIEHLYSDCVRFIDSEQALLGGHPSHPCPRSKEGFDPVDRLRYSPENCATFQLHWLAVKPCAIISNSVGKSLKSRIQELIASDAKLQILNTQIGAEYLLWPMHPWQYQYLLRAGALSELIADATLMDLGQQGASWAATSSLRCVYKAQAPYMLKYSMSLRLTNSLRHLLPHEVKRGLEVVRVWDSPLGQQLQQRYPHFSVIREPAYLALRNNEGQIMESTITVLRDNPFQHRNGDNVVMLGALCQAHPGGGYTLLSQLIKRYAEQTQASNADAAVHWFEQYLHIAIEPMLIAQADYGLLFGAHQQNTLLRLHNNLPCAFYYRDCQGTGYSPLGVDLMHQYLPSEKNPQNHLSEVMGNQLFVYYLIVNNLFALIAAISADGLLDEETLLHCTRKFLIQLRNRKPRDCSCLDYLLESPQLYFKGNLICSLRGINENTMSDPLELYRPMNNPLACLHG